MFDPNFPNSSREYLFHETPVKAPLHGLRLFFAPLLSSYPHEPAGDKPWGSSTFLALVDVPGASFRVSRGLGKWPWDLERHRESGELGPQGLPPGGSPGLKARALDRRAAYRALYIPHTFVLKPSWVGGPVLLSFPFYR